jgi:hypothetical protein
MPAVQHVVVRASCAAVRAERVGAHSFRLTERGDVLLAELTVERDAVRVTTRFADVAVRARRPLSARAFFNDVVVEEEGRGPRAMLYAAGPDGATCAAVVDALLEVLSHLG